MMGFARLPLARVTGLRFWKLCGSGTGEGFTPRPNTAVYAILCVWDSKAQAQSALRNSAIFNRYQRACDENWTVFLETSSARGAWSGQNPFEISDRPIEGPIAALTRATIKPSILMKFWGRVPAISQMIGRNQDVLFKIGIGEVPFFHQVTFSIWPDAEAMANFARKDGPHAKAIRAVRDGLWFKEELYARFSVVETSGTWNGSNPIKLKEAE